MAITFKLEYWIDDEWYVGRLPEVPGVFSQGETLEELFQNIRDAYRLMVESGPEPQLRGVEIPETRAPRLKRRQLIRELVRAGSFLERHEGRHGGRPDLYRNSANGRKAPVARHTEIKESMARLIKEQLGIEED